ncbi:processing peptidase [Desulfurobacterium thermolithotrophum DSM 11699]|uniref:Processing peptidase n=1 Tax=Desulfurobacterium thermolithotrophum (strain DSM 11699 / BSA) TaxID=868864 RepID=F0S2Q1_DESTD|nr:pitrilysin family protein [Desulfurobacterium thermolithotrophum]ADY73123.1 processing peptidase [Desulfurobacterium thermolithotrophum DSM 11699]
MLIRKLDNGVTCAIRERKDLNSVTVSVWIRTGAAFEDDKTRGIAHFLEHMMFNGTENFPPGYIDKEVELLGGEINAATSYDYTYYYINLPYEHGEKAVELISELVLHPLFNNEMLEKERPIVLEEIARSKDNPQEIFLETFMEKLYKRAPYRYPILGFKETVSSFSINDFKTFYEKFYTPERITVSIAGKVNTEKIFEIVEKNFGKIQRDSIVVEPEIEEARVTAETFEVCHPAVAVPNLIFGWRLPPCSREDVYFEILDSLLSSGRSSILYQELRETGIAYAAYSNYQNLLFGSNFSIVVITDKVEESKKAVKKLVEKIVSVSEDEFEFAKAKLFKGEIFGRESGEAEADAIGYALTVMRDADYYNKFFEDLKNVDFKTFKEKISFLLEEPLIGILKGE